MHPGADTEAVLGRWGFEPNEVARLRDLDAVL
jgi:hypothetical protein